MTPDAWYHNSVTALAASGITTGCGNGTTFCPDRPTTRAQMATFLARALKLVELPQPAPTTPTDTFKTVTAGKWHSCGVRTDNTITCWGNNNHGQVDAPAGNFKTVTAGGQHSCGVRTDNTITCWGFNDNGQADAPAGNFKTVTAGWKHSCGVRTDNTITCWGNNRFGQVDAPTDTFKTVTAGGDHSCGVRTDDTITCWPRLPEGVSWVVAGR